MTQPEKIEHILRGSCEYFGKTREEILQSGNNGRSKIWEIRRYILSVLLNYTTLKDWEIANMLGLKNRVTVFYHYKNFTEEISGELYGSQKTKLIYNELLSYLNLKDDENKREK